MALAKKKKASGATAVTAGFQGFPPGGAQFFRELAAEQDREWFAANKARYQTLWVAPMELLLADVVSALAKVFPGIETVPQKIFRIHRDVRFSTDRSPYKTNISAMTSLRPVRRDEQGVSGLYLQFGTEEFVGIGQWMLDPARVLKYRAAVADPKSGARMQKQLDGLTSAGFEVHSHEALKRVPAPYAADHPRGDLLRRKGFALGFPKLPPKLLGKRELVDWIASHATQTAPLIRWLDDAVAG